MKKVWIGVLVAVFGSVVMAQQPSLKAGSMLYIEPTQFGSALQAAMLKKKVPVKVTTDKEKADYFLVETHEAKKEGQGERVAKILVFGAYAGSGKSFDAAVSVVDKDSTVVFAWNMKKTNFQSAAEGIAKHLKENVK